MDTPVPSSGTQTTKTPRRGKYLCSRMNCLFLIVLLSLTPLFLSLSLSLSLTCWDTHRDKLGRRKTEICAIDAVHFRTREQRLDQFGNGSVLREISKAIVGFRRSPITASEWGLCRAEEPVRDLPMIATGSKQIQEFKSDVLAKLLSPPSKKCLTFSAVCIYTTFRQLGMRCIRRPFRAQVLDPALGGLGLWWVRRRR